MSSKKGQITMMITFFFIAVIIITLAAVLAPVGVLFNTEMIKAGEDLLVDANESISGINDAAIRENLQDTTSAAFAAGEHNIEVNNAMFKYSWILIVGITAVTIFIFTRRMIEYTGGGFV